MEKKYSVKSILISLLQAVCFFASYYLIQVLVTAVCTVVLMIAGKDVDYVVSKTLEITLISNIITIFACGLYFKLRSKNYAEELRVRPIRSGANSYVLLFGIFAQFAIAIIISFIPFPESWYNTLESNYEYIEKSSLFIEIIAVGIIGPIVEEIVFRGLILGSFLKSMPKWVAIVVASFIFGLAHGNPIGIIYATGLGIIMCWLYVKFNSIIPSILFHISYNTANSLIGYLPEPYYVLAIYASIPLCVLFIWILNKKSREE